MVRIDVGCRLAMSLFVLPGGREERIAAARGPLAPLMSSLVADLQPVLEREIWIPAEKARLTRRGGRCTVDGALLDFDPAEPRLHRCPRCGRTSDSEDDYRWWVMSYQLWLAERAVHASTLHFLGGEERYADFAEGVLEGYAARYLEYPNRDNVLGPTRPFFSTYLESIWLLQLVVALHLLELRGRHHVGQRVRERVVEPSAALIASFDEGMSNRQVWNNAALAAAARLLDSESLLERSIGGASGLIAHLRGALLSDGSWYEGENYHLFAHRGLWYAVAIAEGASHPIDPALVARFEEGFVVPFLTALPDLTFPSRRDSQYAVSLRQWRFAELCELGLARRPDDPRLAAALRDLYDPTVPRGETTRARSTAEAERNSPPTSLTRADLGWRSLLFALPSLPPLEGATPVTVLLEAQGYGVFRRDAGSLHVALDYGHSGEGHGHPDRLNLVLVDGRTRWLDDPGTGSYVDPSLHWYRSTLAHNAPLVDGRSQRRVHGRLRAFEDRGGAGWIDAEVIDAAPGVVLRRAVVVMPDYVVDDLSWTADRDIVIDLPMHVEAELEGGVPWSPFDPRGGAEPEDGFAFLRDVEIATVSGSRRLRVLAPDGREGDVWVAGDDAARWWRATSFGPPVAGPRRFHVVRSTGRYGRLITVWSTRGAVSDAVFSADGMTVELCDGAVHEHSRTADGWRIALAAGGARSSIDLGGIRRIDPSLQDTGAPATPGTRATYVIPVGGTELRFELGAGEYRRSEPSWAEAGSPRAELRLRAHDGALEIAVDVRKPDPYFAPRVAENPLDNEHPDVNSDGVQLHLARSASVEGEPAVRASWLIVPETGSAAPRVSVRAIEGVAPQLQASWRSTADGYLVECALPIGSALRIGEPFEMQVVVNDMSAERERRRGQLVFGGAESGFVYLRGDRESRLHSFVIAHA